MKFETRRILMGVLAATPVACHTPHTTRPEPETITLAVVNDVPLTLEDALAAFSSSHAGHSMLVRGEPAVRELAGRLVEQELFLAEARALGIPEDEGVVAAVDAYRESAAGILFWRLELDEKVDVPDEEVEAFYAKTDVAFRLSIIETATRDESEELRDRVAAGEDFADLAEAHSVHSSRTFGGALPYVRRGELPSDLETAAFALEQPGSLSPIVPTDSGFAFVRLEERSENSERPPRDVMIPRIRNVLEGRMEDEIRAEVEGRLRSDAEVSVIDGLLTRAALLEGEALESVVARSAGETLTLGGIRAAVDLDLVQQATDEQVAEAVREMAESWALARAVELAARRDGLLEDPEVVQQTESFRRDAILGMLNREFVYADLDVTDEEVREYYERSKETDFTQPAEVHLAYIVVATEPEALEIVERLTAGEDFGEIARGRSIDASSAAHGGRIGWIREGQLLPEVELSAFALEPGQVSDPIETDVGTFVLKALDRKEAVIIPFERCRDAARRRLMKSLQQEVHATWAKRLRERADVRLDEQGIEAAVAWLDRQQPAEEPELGPPAPPQHGPVGPAPDAPGPEPRPAGEGPQ